MVLLTTVRRADCILCSGLLGRRWDGAGPRLNLPWLEGGIDRTQEYDANRIMPLPGGPNRQPIYRPLTNEVIQAALIAKFGPGYSAGGSSGQTDGGASSSTAPSPAFGVVIIESPQTAPGTPAEATAEAAAAADAPLPSEASNDVKSRLVLLVCRLLFLLGLPGLLCRSSRTPGLRRN
jgi:hypothetical protein